MSSGSGWYAFIIETTDDCDMSWWWITNDGSGPSRGVCDHMDRSPADFGRASIDGYLDHLVNAKPGNAEYWLHHDDYDTAFRIRVWDIAVVRADHASGGWTPDPSNHTGRQYPLALAAAGLDPDSVVTLPGRVVRHRLATKAAARHAAAAVPSRVP